MTAGRLPTGRAARAALSRDDVVRNQRERILRAMAAAVAENGYAATTVSVVIGRAGVSRATFYEQFADRQDCFLAAFDLASGVLLAQVQADQGDVDLASPAADPRRTFAGVLRRYLDGIADDHELARVFLVDIHALGPAGVAHRSVGQHFFVDAIAAIFGVQDAERRFACELLVAGVGALVTARLAANDLDGIRGLHAPVVALADRLLLG